MPAPGAFIFLAAVSASGCLASPAHPGESVCPAIRRPGGPHPHPACPGACPWGSGPITCVHVSRPGRRAGAWGAAETEPLSVRRACGRQAGGWVGRGSVWATCVCARMCVCAGVCGEPGEDGASGGAGPRGRRLSRADPAQAAALALGGPGAGRAPFAGAWAGDGGHVRAPSAPKGDRPHPC